ILTNWKNDLSAFYESDPVDYNEDKELNLISISKSLVNFTELSEHFEKINEHFETEIKKRSKFIEWDELSNISKLDEGCFGLVFKADWAKTHSNVVCKALINLKDIGDKHYTAFIHELTMHTRADLCENIVRFLGVSKEIINDRYFLIMEYANDGNLREFIKKNNSSLSWNKRLELACHITKGLCYLHGEEIIHRDLLLNYLNNQKSDNISYCKKTDIYSLGMIFWELSSGRPPFENQSNMIDLAIKIIKGDRENIVYGTPEYRNLYTKCWDADPYKRPDIEDAHKLLEGIVNSKILSEFDSSNSKSSNEQTQSTEIYASKLLNLSLNDGCETSNVILDN
ncbi:25195_t:CDS:2, partial [Gigaspora margarita]